ncbi:MAG: glycosyltransferase family 4 protein [Flavobacteriia bacterium]|jgi:glycosyltransferase involved in cell wall biosynthesis
MKKLILFGPNSVHVSNYIDLIEGYFDEILVLTDGENKNITKYKQVVVSFAIRNPFQNKKTIKEIEKQIIDFKPDVIHLHNIGTGAFLLEKATRNLSIPKIATAWGSDVLVAPKRSFIFRKILSNVFANFNYFTSDALFMAYEMQKMSSKNLDITIANFGVEEVQVDFSKKENIVYSNRLHNDLYNIDLIIDLFCDFLENETHKDWKLIIAATGNNTENLKEKASKSKFSNQIEFVGWIDQAQNQAWYKKAKIYISIPKSDGTSIGLLEAMENACIPIVSNLPANNEWITDGYNGLVFQNGNQKPFEKALNLDFNKIAEINREIIKMNGLKATNRAKFISIYDRIKDSK